MGLRSTRSIQAHTGVFGGWLPGAQPGPFPDGQVSAGAGARVDPYTLQRANDSLAGLPLRDLLGFAALSPAKKKDIGLGVLLPRLGGLALLD